MIKVKNVLNDIVDMAYAGHEKQDKYKRFFVELIDKSMKSKHGDYNLNSHRIRIFNLYRDDASIIATTIHELAHHIDNVNRGTSDHSSFFYEVYKHLLYTSMDMNLFKKDEFLSATRDASDSRKVAVMIDCYTPTNIGYKEDELLVSVKNGFPIKDALKERGYSYNKIGHTWEKEVSSKDLDTEKKVLDTYGAEYDVTNPTELKLKKSGFIVAGKGSYEHRQELKELGFHFESKPRCWKKKIEDDNIDKLREMFPDIEFTTDC